MADKNIFNNYKPNCQVCGAELDENDQFCQYCGADLTKVNQQHHDNEIVIKDAIDDIEQAKRQLEKREKQFVQNKKDKKSADRIIFKWTIIIVVGFFAIVFICGLFAGMVEAGNERKVEQFKDELYSQSVNVQKVKEIDIDEEDFEDTNKQTPAGYIQESDDYFLIPFYADNYYNETVLKGKIVVSKDGFEEFGHCDSNRIHIQYEDFSLDLDFENSDYYERTIDMLYIDASETDEIRRADSIRVGDHVFECYIDDSYDVHFMTSPYRGCFVDANVYYYDDDQVQEDHCPVLYLECSLESN